MLLTAIILGVGLLAFVSSGVLRYMNRRAAVKPLLGVAETTETLERRKTNEDS